MLKKTALPVGDLWLLLAELARQGFADYADAEAFSDLAAVTSKFVVWIYSAVYENASADCHWYTMVPLTGFATD